MIRALTLSTLIASVAAFVAPQARGNTLSMVADGMSRSMPFLKKPKNLEGLVVCYYVYYIISFK